MRKKILLSIILILCSPFGYSQDEHVSHNTIVFVHGAWGGGWDYKIIESILTDKGHVVYRPTLTGLGERQHLNGPNVTLDTHIQDIVNVLEFEDLENIILIGHSYGGMVITGVAHRVPSKIKHLIYTDAMLPVDGESVLDLTGDRLIKHSKKDNNQYADWEVAPWWPDWGKDVPHPLNTLKQPIKLGNRDAEKIPATYILTKQANTREDDFSQFAKRAKRRGWLYHELATGHNPHRTMPNELAELILKSAATSN